MKRFFPVLQNINVPNAVTTVGFLLGMSAMFFMISNNLRMALILLLFAGITDFADGFIATKLRQSTAFGGYLDSLVDFFNFSVLPSICALIFIGREPLMIVAAFFYCACGLWRLAYFNVLKGDGARGFTGMPVPGAAEVALVSLWFLPMLGFAKEAVSVVYILCGLFMISGLPLKKYGVFQILFGAVCVGLIVYLLLI